MKNATRLMTATPPITPPATAAVERLPLPFLPPSFDTASMVVVDAAVEDDEIVDRAVDASPIVVKGVADVVDVESVCRTWLCGGVAAKGVVDDVVTGKAVATSGEFTRVVEAATVLVSATLDCEICGTTAAGEILDNASEVEVVMDICAIEAADVVVTAAGGGVVSKVVACTAGGASTCEADDVDAAKEVDAARVEEAEKALVVLVCVLTSVLGTAVHLFPPRDVMNSPRGKLESVDILRSKPSVARGRCQLARSSRYYGPLYNRSVPPLKGVTK